MEIIKEWSEKVTDPKLKLIFTAIHDEVKHHDLLLSIEKNMARAMGLTKDEL